MITAFLSLGANQQDPVRRIQLANHKLQALPSTHIVKASDIFLTSPFGVTQQPLFYNQVIQIQTLLNPFKLLELTQNIEKQLGRVRHLPWGPRMIDIDILDYDKIILNHPKLKLPHPQIWERHFISETLFKLSAFTII